jgi:hypothetical protein
MKRRQSFLTEEYYINMIATLDSSNEFWDAHAIEEDYLGQAETLKAQNIKSDLFMSLVMRYTAGEPLAKMLPSLERYIEATENYQLKLAISEREDRISPLNLEDSVGEYEEFLQIISICILLDRIDLLQRLVRLIDQAGFSGDDFVCEGILSKVLAGRKLQDGWYHKQYTPLVDVICSTTEEETSKKLASYCEGWYVGFSDVQTAWHDTHLSMADDDGSYFGYWAFEAGAVAYLYGVDDRGINHPVYPKDLVEYARNSPRRDSLQGPGRVSANNPCPKTGYWFSSAQSESKRYFNQGEIMPEFKGSSWGSTIWYWSGENE